MPQAYHSNAKTNLNIRFELRNNFKTNSKLASRFNISKQTVSKWKNRNFVQDSSCKPLNIQYVLTDLEKPWL
jgi:DNA-binding transcriptional regulator YiaG